MITLAKRLIEDPAFQNPTVLMLLDRNELEEQLFRNLSEAGFEHMVVSKSKRHLRELLRGDRRGLIVSMIHKFDDVPANLNTRRNIFVLVDEAHRTTGYLDKYSIRQAIEDGTTVPLHYQLAPNDLQVDRETLETEFLDLADSEGVSDVEELNRVLERAATLSNMPKNPQRMEHVAAFVANHYREVIEPMGYKAFLLFCGRIWPATGGADSWRLHLAWFVHGVQQAAPLQLPPVVALLAASGHRWLAMHDPG